MNLSYLYSKFFKKVLRGKSILNSRIDNTAKIYSGTEFYNSSLGRHSYVGYDCEVHNCDIGAFCSIANHFIVGGAEHPLDWVSTSPAFQDVDGGAPERFARNQVSEGKMTVIGNDVWIGSRVIIKQGVRVGAGAVIGAGSVVTKDVPDYAIVVGCPAKIIKYRFDENRIKRLLASKWWSLPEKKIREFAKYINDVESFLECVESYLDKK